MENETVRDYKFELVLAGCSLLVIVFFWREFLALLAALLAVFGVFAIFFAPFALAFAVVSGFKKLLLARREAKSQRDESDEVRPEP
jgi:uncharacterized membrane protein